MSIEQRVEGFSHLIEAIGQIRQRAHDVPHHPLPPAHGLYALAEQLTHVRALLRAKRSEEAEAYLTHILDSQFRCWRCA